MTTVIVTFRAKHDQVKGLLEFLSNVQTAVMEAGGLSISLLQDQNDPTKVFEIETWHAAAEHQRFVKGAAEAGAFKPFDSLLAQPFEVNYLTTVKRTEKDKVA